MTSPAKTQVAPAADLFQKKVGAADKGARLDIWLRTQNPAWSRKAVKQLLDEHRVTVNRKLVYVASWALASGDIVAVHAEKRKKELYLQVLYEDPFLLAVNKPPYLAFEELIGAINAYLKRKEGAGFHPYLGMLHRLDKDTSGVFIVTKDKSANTLVEQFKTHQLRKTYVAVVEGQIDFFEKRFTASLKKGTFKGGKKVEITAKKDEGKWSQSDIRVLERYRNATLLEIVPTTGRTHQIRAHLSALGHAIVGDRVYTSAGSGVPAIRFSRHALHAQSLAFIHPTSNKKLKITAPLPKDMQALIDQLRI